MKRPSLWSLVIPLSVVLIFGLTTVYSTTPSLFLSQSVFLLVGIFAFLIISLIDNQTLKALSPYAYLVCVFFLVITYLVGTISRGSLRWIDLGPFRFQTSEFAKPLLIWAFATIFDNSKKDLFHFIRNLVLIALPFFLVLFQPDLGSALIIGSTSFMILLHSRIPLKYPAALLLIGALLSPIAYNFLHDYQKLRLINFLNPYSDPSRSGYNVIQATVAIGSGQLLGKGVRQGTQSHLRFLPERHTDFAFASFAEEFGFIGVFILLTSFFFLLNWLLRTSTNSNNFSRNVALGAFWLFFFQMFINIAMNLGIAPVTGITLPFVSYGGSSLISLFIVLGLVFATRLR